MGRPGAGRLGRVERRLLRAAGGGSGSAHVGVRVHAL